jgi:DNA-binding LytR/AlgR family response regulator
MRVLVVDDEPPARRRLVRMLAALPGVDLVGEAEDAESALRVIEAQAPDLVLLDIGLPQMSGLTLAQRYADLPPIVFVTAYDEFAVQAFEVNAVDYLLKPVRPERLAAALERVRSRAVAGRDQVTRALNAVVAPDPTRVVTAGRGEVRFFDARDITRFWSSDKYTVFRAQGQEQLTEEPLGLLEERLRPLGFVRVHRAELVHLPSVRALRLGAGAQEVELADGQVARVSRRSVRAIKDALGV